MTPEHVTQIVRQALFTAMTISSPMLLIALIVGFTIALFQSVTQINEMTLTFVPKILIFAFSVSYFFPWMLKIMLKYTSNLLIHHWDKLTEISTYSLK
ncbi:MAG: flagellar biosynthesis protein FliQ [Chlamydiales bacterium]|nr:flagellar biosynthesis protein FliQ [Chlamydiales bacterium]NCF70842.1 flagellar biosynthesis protein FliQ [Chlamydiales bacterium]